MGDRNPTANLMAGAGLGGTLQTNPVAPNATYVNMGPQWGRPKGEGQPGSLYYGSTTTGQSANNAVYGPQMMTTDKAKAVFDFMPGENYAAAARYTAALAGHDKSPRWTIQSKYNDAIDSVANYNLMSGQNLSVWEYMDMVAGQEIERRGGSGGSGGGGGGGGGGPSTTVQYNLTNQSDAEVLVDQALNQYLGRQATDKERDTFWKTLNKAQMKSPTVTSSSGGANPSVMTSGGLNTQQAAKEFATSRKDAAEYMANTQYTDWLMEKVSADPTEGIASGL